jgi:4-amino-4-deoxy-L-arabinose transferase-like glycosyltransferase
MFLKNFWQKLDRFDRTLVIILIVSFLVRIFFVFFPRVIGWDEAVYLNLGKQLSANPFSYTLLHSHWKDFAPLWVKGIYNWPNIGFRAPLLPYSIALFYFLRLGVFVPFIVPIFSTISIWLVYILCKNLFNKKTALYSAAIFSLTPIVVCIGQKVWTESVGLFFVLATVVFFWLGFEKGKNKHKILFGVFYALSIFGRYTSLWMAPVFLLYFIVRDGSLKFLKDKYLWYAVIVFFAIIFPWLVYGFLTYGNPIGPFIHGITATTYFGGVQPWYFYLTESWLDFSIVGIVLMLSLIYIIIKKEFKNRGVYFLLIWLTVIFIIASYVSHKEGRYIVLLVPAVALLSGYLLDQIRFGLVATLVVIAILGASVFGLVKNVYRWDVSSPESFCYRQGITQIKNFESDAVVLARQSPVVYYYTGKSSIFYPDPWNFEEVLRSIGSNQNIPFYVFYSNYEVSEDSQIKKDFDSNFDSIWQCQQKWGNSVIYKVH